VKTKRILVSPMFVSMFATIVCLAPLGAQTLNRRAEIVGGGDFNQGKCTVEVVVDGAAEIQIRGDNATMRNLNGQPPQWRRLQCTSPLPANPVGFRFEGVDGRGRQTLLQDPGRGGAAVVRIEDPDGGAEGYTFDLIWGNWSGNFNNGPQGRNLNDGFQDRDRDGRPDRDRGFGRGEGNRFTTEQAVSVCQDAVRQEAMQRFGPARIFIRDTRIDNNPGRNDWVIGMIDVSRGRFRRNESYRFSCSVDFRSGVVRTAHIGVPNY
jgi:hypothetical protein